jgi:hypothetical protein
LAFLFYFLKDVGNNMAEKAADATIQWYSSCQERLERRDNIVAKEISPVKKVSNIN